MRAVRTREEVRRALTSITAQPHVGLLFLESGFCVMIPPVMGLRSIKIGNASGYWGDDPDALRRQVTGGALDYISMDFLAEVTMSIMQKQKNRDPQRGYATDFITMLEPVLTELVDKKICVISNAGGVNPIACADAIAALATAAGVRLKIAIVHGDGILAQVQALHAQGVSFRNMEDGRPFAHIADRLEAANVYFGAQPVLAALRDKPDIVVCGRVTDTGLTLAALMHELEWSPQDWDRLAAGVIAGHLLECGCQVTGGNFTDWHLVGNFRAMGYPIVEMFADGTFVVTKHPDSGGLVSVDTVREQLVYEMGDPHNYITPDVICDFSTLELEQQEGNRVLVSRARGRPPTATHKVSMCYRDGFKASGSIVVSGPHALAKARKFAEIFQQRIATDVDAWEEMLIEYGGQDACHRSLAAAHEGDEILLRLSARATTREKLQKFVKLVPALILSGPPGVAIVGAAPRVQEIISYWPALLPKDAVPAKLTVHGKQGDTVLAITPVPVSVTPSFPAPQIAIRVQVEDAPPVAGQCVPLARLCLARSGDKSDAANIGVLARSAAAYAFLDRYLTAQRVKNYFRDLCHGEVKRYALPRWRGFNFVLSRALGGGGTKSLRIDPQGKTLAQALLRQEVCVPPEVMGSTDASTKPRVSQALPKR